MFLIFKLEGGEEGRGATSKISKKFKGEGCLKRGGESPEIYVLILDSITTDLPRFVHNKNIFQKMDFITFVFIEP